MAVAMAGTLATTNSASSLTVNLNAECIKPSLRSHSPSLARLPKSRLVVRAQANPKTDNTNGRRAAVVGLGAALFSAFAISGNANAGLVEDLLAKSAANKDLNDAKRLATSGANIARAYTVQFGICQFPYNFTGCQDLARLKNVPFLTDDIKLECQGKAKYRCGSNVFWQGK
ncbi:hypothetical protein SUGI_0521020 [Cryptomeria japonica]|uniref:photosystem I reaction center subunit N, chloroplastic n=1 Tax=Cryptomeria japonica TaxID=3369 RepID=UPI002408E5A0|nr:photosystem I reaction center subunit N, chloroplastic [Cryptomeria japonica]GLJ26740.1 hypothetical protein SUGI_0521020 [Cryptomeria japonica]